MRLAALALIAASMGFAATPDFSGNWKLNGSKSQYGDFPPPTEMTQKVTQSANKMTVETKMTSDMGPGEFTSTYTMDGKETTSQGFGAPR